MASDLDELTTLDPNWQAALAPGLTPGGWDRLGAFLAIERAAGHVVHPPTGQVLEAFRQTPFSAVRVVILGQDPYHAPGQAMGLAFSVPAGVRVPPSLRNVFIEIEADLGLPRPISGDLRSWAAQGVLLLNATLTVRESRPGSHRGHGWEQLTDAAIGALSAGREGLVFMLWGRQAQVKADLIDADRHLVLEAPHPSPLSAHTGFLGCRHFSAANDHLIARGTEPIDWALAPVAVGS